MTPQFQTNHGFSKSTDCNPGNPGKKGSYILGY